jgi:hypothetical protein
VLILLTGLVNGCQITPARPRSDAVRDSIAGEVAKGIEATRQQDIDAYMALIPDGLTIRSESGETVTRTHQRANALRDWAIIPATRRIVSVLDSVWVAGDSAIVFRWQYWDRLMLERDGRTRDTVVTTQLHREIWRSTPRGWRAFRIEELGGLILVNGVPYTP